MAHSEPAKKMVAELKAGRKHFEDQFAALYKKFIEPNNAPVPTAADVAAAEKLYKSYANALTVMNADVDEMEAVLRGTGRNGNSSVRDGNKIMVETIKKKAQAH